MAAKTGGLIWKRLQELESLGIIGEIRGRGLIIGVEFVKDTETKEQFPASVGFGIRVGKKALENGLIVRYDPNWVAFAPPLITSSGEANRMMDIFSESVTEVLKSAGT